MTTEARQKLGTYFFALGGEEENRPQIALASDEFAPLICRVVRAVRWRWALGLDSRWGSPLRSVFHPQPAIILYIFHVDTFGGWSRVHFW